MVQIDAELLQTLGVFAMFYVTHFIYSRVKRRFCVVSKPDADTQVPALSEKSALLVLDDVKAGIARGGDIEGQHDVNLKVSDALPKSLIAWALLVLPVNIAAVYVPNYCWSTGEVDINEPGAMSRVLLGATGVLPIVNSVQVVVMALLLTRPNLLEKAERYRMLMRLSMLDGVFLPLLVSLWLDHEFPGKFDSLNWTTLAFVAYASQSAVWSIFFRRSKRESQAKSGIL